MIPVPVGTTLSTDDGRIIGELEELGSKIVVAKGGRGGSAATVNWCGEKGERGIVRLEMRLHSDVALVGYDFFFNANDSYDSTYLQAVANDMGHIVHCCGHVVARDVFLEEQTGNICFDTKCF